MTEEQSVSKWEGAQAIPDLQKILKMAELFGVSTDYLLKDEMEPEDFGEHTQISKDDAQGLPMRKVSLEEANEYLELKEKAIPKIAYGVSLCIFAAAPMIFLLGLSEGKIGGITEMVAALIGLIVLFLMVAVAVFLFIYYGSFAKEYKFLEKEPIETAYGVRGMVLEKKKAFQGVYIALLAVGVVLCIISPLPLMVVALLELPDAIVLSMVALLLLIVAAAVNLIVRAAGIQGSFDKLLQENDYSVKKKKASRAEESIFGLYWSVVLAIYLGWSFWTMNWGFTWIVWPVAGVLYGAVSAVVKLLSKTEE